MIVDLSDMALFPWRLIEDERVWRIRDGG